MSHPLSLHALPNVYLTWHLVAGSDANKLGAFLSFSGDAEDEAVDMFAEAEKATEEEEEEEDPEAEPEDDFNAAWEVLDLARAIFEKGKDESDEAKLKLADTYMCLGDVSLETGSSILQRARAWHGNLMSSQRSLTKQSKITRLVLALSRNSCLFPPVTSLKPIIASALSWI